jgi:hypothetical protein
MTDSVAPKPQRNSKGQFLKGSKGLGGRKPGTRNGLEATILGDYIESWDVNGKRVLEYLAQKEPGTYAKIGVALLPKHSVHRVEDLKLMSDAELVEIISAGLEQRAVAQPLPNAGDQETKH